MVTDNAYRERMMKIPGYIVLIKKPGDSNLYGPVENSFSIGVEKNRTEFFWSSENATSNLGGKFKIDGLKNVQKSIEYWKKNHPDWEFSYYDARDEENLPVTINWELWLDGSQFSKETFSGVKNKHEARNLRFLPKCENPDFATEAPALKMNVKVFPL